MVFYLPESLETATSLDELTPRQIVVELDKYVIGQSEAKRSCRHRPAQPHAATKAAPGAGGRHPS